MYRSFFTGIYYLLLKKVLNMDKLYLVMPAYNEEDNIEAVVRSWYPVFEASDVSEASSLW